MRAPGRLLLLVSLLVASASCGPTVDLTKGLQLVDVSTGWFDAGIVNGENKLVPTVSFKIKNISNQKLVALQINALFRRLTDKDEWGSGFVPVAGSEGLPPGATSPPYTLKSQRGYTSTESRQDMLRNSHFVDAKVEISAKYASLQWKRIADYPIARVLLTP
jgi:hypothetical protein